MKFKMVLTILLIVIWAFIIPKITEALDFPTREIEFIAAFAPGSNTDNFARLAAKFGEKYVGKPIVVVNKPGGGGARGFTALATAKPDGYTIGLLSQSVIAHPYLLKGITFHYKKSFKLISQIDYSAQGLCVKKGGPWDISLKEFVKRAKEKPETIKVGIGGTWTAQDFVRAIFEEEAGIKLINVRFAGAAEVIPNLLGGHLDCFIGPASEWSHLYKGGKVSVLAVSNEVRDPRFPDLTTFKEQGYDVALPSYHWIGAPAGTPDAIVNFLADAFKKAFAEPGFKEAADNLGATAAWAGPEDCLKTMEKIEQLYLRVIKKYGLKPE
jgi:tripartite-type tricarboxylate transporter receptor subunit TctC